MPPGRGVPHARFPVDCLFTLFCRAGDFARRTLLFLKIFNVRRGQDPALQTGINGRFPRKPRATVHPCREAYMPPLQTPGTAPMTPRPGVCGGVTAHEKCFLKKSNVACIPAFSKPSRAARHHNFSFFIFHFFTSLPGPGLLRPFLCPARLWACLSLSPRCRRWSGPARQTGRRGVSVWFPRPARRWTGSCRPGS